MRVYIYTCKGMYIYIRPASVYQVLDSLDLPCDPRRRPPEAAASPDGDARAEDASLAASSPLPSWAVTEGWSVERSPRRGGRRAASGPYASCRRRG